MLHLQNITCAMVIDLTINYKSTSLKIQVYSTGAVRGQSETKHDILRVPRESLLVFCLILDYQYQ